MKVIDAINDYLFTAEVNDGKASKTIVSYKRDLTIYNNYLEKNRIIEIEKIKDTDIKDFITFLNKDYSVASINRIKTSVRNLHTFLNFKYGYKDPSVTVKVNKRETTLVLKMNLSLILWQHLQYGQELEIIILKTMATLIPKQ